MDPTGSGYVCNLPNFAADDYVKATFTVQAGPDVFSEAHQAVLWASFKVAEKVSDQGANQNTAFAQALMTILATGSDANATFLSDQAPLVLSTGDAPPSGDTQVTTIRVPGAQGGLITIFESDDPFVCPRACIGQTVSANVRDGVDLSPLVIVWTLKIIGIGAGSQGGAVHELDNGNSVFIANTSANQCTSDEDLGLHQVLPDRQEGRHHPRSFSRRTRTGGSAGPR